MTRSSYLEPSEQGPRPTLHHRWRSAECGDFSACAEATTLMRLTVFGRSQLSSFFRRSCNQAFAAFGARDALDYPTLPHG